MQQLLSIEDAAVVLQVTPETVRRYMRQGRIRGSKLGRMWRIAPAELERFLSDSQPGGKVSEPASGSRPTP